VQAHPAQLGGLEAVLDAGPDACGYEDQWWTLSRIAGVVWQRFGVEYTVAGLDLLLHRTGWSLCRRRYKLHYADLRVMPTSRPGWQVAA
jgi:transposase